MHPKIIKLLAFVLFALSITTTVNAHIVSNSLTRTTGFEYSESQNLKMNYKISIPSSELTLVYNIADLNGDKNINQDENKKLGDLIKEKVYIEYDGVTYRSKNTKILSAFEELNKNIYPTLLIEVDYGNVTLNQEYKKFKIFNNLQFNTVVQQDWNIDLPENNKNIEFQNLGFYPEKAILSNQLIGEAKSSYGVKNPSFFSRISNNELYNNIRNYLMNPQLDFFSILSLLGICFIFGALHSFQPGHGKAVIGSYIASIKGSYKDSALMAIATTISHTIVILGLGLLWALLKDGLRIIIPFINFRIEIPKELVNIIQLAVYIRYIASISLIITGIYMALKYYQQYIDYKLKVKYGQYDEVILDTQSDSTFKVVDHGDHKHYIPSKKLNFKESIWLGLNTGLTPCLDALILFTLAVSFGLGWLGFFMILVFSIGLGISLTLIGYLASKTISLASKQFSSVERLSLLLPIFSSIAIIILAFINLFTK
jgi:nickel/cobalt transporter (NicO) family protein